MNTAVKTKSQLTYATLSLLRLKRELIPFCISELETLEWWISGLMLNPLFFLISRLNIAYTPHELNLQIN